MSTRGVVIVRKKGEKPSYFYLRSDANMYPGTQYIPFDSHSSLSGLSQYHALS